ncbi:MAG: CcdC family protein [Vulcanimicrobiota bacterium]
MTGPHTIAVPLMGACGVLLWRLRETSRPVTLKALIIPPLGMSTGLGMFLYPPARVPLAWAATAFVLGAIFFATPMIRTSKMEWRDDAIYLRRSPAFLWVMFILVAIRLALHGYVEHLVSPLQTGALFFLLAFGMILRWRADLLRQYRQLQTAESPAQ